MPLEWIYQVIHCTAAKMHGYRRGRAFYHWFAATDTPEERKLILKLDLLIVPYAFLGYASLPRTL